MNLGVYKDGTLEYIPHKTGGIYVSSYQRGRHTYGDPVVMNYLASAKLVIGDYCSIADGVEILLGGEHHLEFVSTFPFDPVMGCHNIPGYPHTNGDVTIGNDVFIGRNAMILSGVRIGDGAVIGAGAVIARDVEPYAIYAGNRAKCVGFRIDEEHIEHMLKIKWWNWHESRIRKFAPLLQSGDVEKFIEEAYVL